MAKNFLNEKKLNDEWAKFWVATYFYKNMNHREFEEREFINKIKEHGLEYIKWGREICPSTGKHHMQIFFCLRNKIRFSTLGKSLKCYISTMRGSIHQNDWYTEKEGEWFEEGIRPKIPQEKGQQQKDIWAHIYKLAKEDKIEELAETYPSHYIRNKRALSEIAEEHKIWESQGPKICIWLYSPETFVVGKSTFLATHFPLDKNKNFWHIMESSFWEGYRGQPNVIFDDLDTTNLEFGGLLKRITSDTPKILNIKHSSAISRIKTVIIASNFRPTDLWPNEIGKAIKSRFKVFRALRHDKDDLLVTPENTEALFPHSLSNYLRLYDLI